MKIIVCVKQVPDTGGNVAVNPDGTLNRRSMETIINPNDLNAVEAALRFKDDKGAQVIAITMGPPQAEEMLRELMAMGVDRAVLVSSKEFGGSDTFATSQVLAAAIQKIGLGKGDLVLCGQQAIDGDTAQVGPQIGEKLGIPQITYVAEIHEEGDGVICKRMLEDGYAMVYAGLPCLLACVKELNTPRYMRISGIVDCFDKTIDVYDYHMLKDDVLIRLHTVGLKGSPTQIFKTFTPPPKGAGVMLTGTDSMVCAQLAEQLKAKHLA